MCIPASAADAAAVNPKVINTLFANGLITLLIYGNPVFNKGPSNLPENPPDWIILLICALKLYVSGRIIIESISYFCFLSCQ